MQECQVEWEEGIGCSAGLNTGQDTGLIFCGGWRGIGYVWEPHDEWNVMGSRLGWFWWCYFPIVRPASNMTYILSWMISSDPIAGCVDGSALRKQMVPFIATS